MTASNKSPRTTLEDLTPVMEEVPLERLRFVTGGAGNGGSTSSTTCVTHNGALGDTIDYVIDGDATLFHY